VLPSQDDTSAVRAAFRLGEWAVEPELGRISRAGTVVQLRPRAMEVLVALADLNGGLASKQHLIDTVWRTEFVSDNALTHVVAELRTALGDDTDNPSHIETIPRRGYRLIAPVTRLEEQEGGGQRSRRTA
jgi:transcriptional activator of cad operon